MKTANIKIIYSRPPFWRILKMFFPDYDPDGTIAVAFGRVVYANQDFDESFKIHEETHLRQQKRSYFFAVIWWARYLFSKKFRFKQELEAFRRQYLFIKSTKGYDSFKALLNLSDALASPLYGNMVTRSQARRLLESLIEEYDG